MKFLCCILLLFIGTSSSRGDESLAPYLKALKISSVVEVPDGI